MFSINIYRNKKWVTAICFFIALASVSCNKLVEIDRPRNTISTETVFKTDANAYAALAGMYSYLIDAEGDVPTFSNGGLTVFASMLSGETRNITGVENQTDYEFSINKLNPSNEMVRGVLWSRAYKVIYLANSILEGVASSTSIYLTDSARKQITAEAKLGRAFSHFYLVNLFGDVPLMTTTDITKTANMGRTPSAEVYKQIEQDLKDAFLQLRDDYSASHSEKIRVNKWCAAAMLARVYLYQQRWAEAEAQASLVIGTGKYQALPPADVFNPNSAEAIWQLKHNSAGSGTMILQEPKFLVPELRFSWMPPELHEIFLDPGTYESIAAYLTPRYPLSDDMLNAFEPNDQRKTKWIDVNLTPAQAPWNGAQHAYPVKYEGGLADNTYAHSYYSVLRISEQYLIRAEARAQQGTNLTGAATDINEIRSKSGLGNTDAATQSELLDAVMQERRIELFAEWGHRWFDLKRTKRAAAVLGAIAAKQPWSDDKLLLPIPALEIQSNPRLKPNPGY